MSATTIISLMAEPSGTVLGAAPRTAENVHTYLSAGGYQELPHPDRLLEHIAEAGLGGRGGAGFPAAVKLRAVRDGGAPPVVVANGEEGEPGSAKDRWLLRARPHLVLDGLAHAAAITGATRGCVYLSDPAAGAAVRRALAEREQPLPIEIVETPHTYVAGEESAVVRRINGGPALPTAKPPRPFEQGVDDRPTLVSNVETLARIALIASRPHVRRRTAGSALVTLSGGDGDAVLAEVSYGVTLRNLATLQGTHDPAGALMGGLFGGLIGAVSLDLPLDPSALAAARTAAGCGAIRFLGAGECPVSVACEAVGHLATQSARQCGVCVAGTGSIRDTVHTLHLGTAAPDALAKLLRWSEGLPGRGACGLLDASAGTAGSLLRAFPDITRAHLDSPCPSCAAAPRGRGLSVPVPEIAPSPAAPAPALKGTP
ncbi:NADH-ubiquinone oxidoreductase-F iron-sulfur binding region domain-containing protein [Streptomyces sp. NPDC051098]|uniref:NADH-ubiquinone oxidoreductase-F iron-sulfur binding region domain-containing protein n=1 Tax=Streptomyces sp. NPDC051098 TaxID=3155411 RepID=UPI0034279FF1